MNNSGLFNIFLYEYRHIYDIAGKIAELSQADKNDKNVKFLVPSAKDKEIFYDMLRNDKNNQDAFLELPDVWVWNDLYREAADFLSVLGHKTTVKRQIDPPDNYLIIRHIVNNFVKNNKNKDIPSGAVHYGFTSQLSGDIKELLAEGVTPELLARILDCTQAPDCDNSCSVSLENIFCRLYHDYDDYLSAHGLADSASVAALTAQLIGSLAENALPFTIALVGFLSFTHSQLELMRTLSEKLAQKCIIFKPYTGLENFPECADQLGIDMSSPSQFARLPSANKAPAVVLSTQSDASCEFESLAHSMSALAEGGVSYADMGVYLPVGGAKKLYELTSYFERFGVPYFLSSGTPVSETLIGKIPAMIGQNAGFYTQNTLRLLTSPCILSSSDIAALDIDLALSKGIEGVSQWAEYLRERLSDAGLAMFSDIAAFAALIKKGATAIVFFEALYNIVKGLPFEASAVGGDFHAFDADVRLISLAARELKRKIDTLRELSPPLGEAASIEMSGQEAVYFLQNWAQSAGTQEYFKTEGCAQIYTNAPPALWGKKIFFMTGVTSAAWPGPIAASPLINDEIKARLDTLEDEDVEKTHLPLAADLRLQREALFRRLVMTASEECLISRPSKNEKGQPLAPSYFESSLAEIARDIRLDGGDKYNEYRAQGAQLNAQNRGIDRLSPPSLIVKPDKNDKKGRLSDLDGYLSCPYRYCCEAVKGLSSKIPSAFDAAKSGSATHKFFASFYSISQTDRKQPDFAITLFDEIFKREYPEIYEPRLKRYLKLVRKNIFNMLAFEENLIAELAKMGCCVLENLCEKDTPELVIGGVSFTGRCDRIDIVSTPQGELLAFVYDYKSGGASNYKDSLQLAAYCAALEDALCKDGIKIAGYGYLSLKDCDMTGKLSQEYENFKNFKKIYKARGSLEEAKALALEGLDDFALSIKSGIYRANYDAKMCPRCPFSALCRRSEAVGEYAAEDAEEE